MSQVNEQRIQQKVDEVKRRFEERISKIQENGNQRINQIGEDSPNPNAFEAGVNATFDVKWKITTIKLDIPKFSDIDKGLESMNLAIAESMNGIKVT